MAFKNSAAQAAKLLKAEIKAAYPELTVSVKSQVYSMGCSVNVTFTDQRPEVRDAIAALAGKYQYGHYDGMNDIYEYSNTIDGLPQAKHVFVDNVLSADLRETIRLFVIELFQAGDYAVSPHQIDTTIWQQFSGAQPEFWAAATAPAQQAA